MPKKFSRPDLNGKLDKNLFYDSQLLKSNQTWSLYAQNYNFSVSESKSSDTDPDSASKSVFTPKYGKWIELLRGVCNETSVGASVSNSYDSNVPKIIADSVGVVKDTANNIMDNLSAIGTVASSISSLLSPSDSSDTETTDSSSISEAASAAGSLVDILSSNLNAQLVVGTDYVQMYRGTQSNYQLPAINTTIYHGAIPGHEGPTGVLETLDLLIDTCSGSFYSPTDLANLAKGTTGKNYVNESGSIGGVFVPPNGYTPVFTNIGNTDCINGTLCLVYGGYLYKNLLVDSFDFKVSTMFAMDKNGNSTKDPLYATINISFRQATVLIKENLKQFIRRK